MTSWQCSNGDTQRVMKQITKNVQQSLDSLTTYSAGVAQYETSRIMESIKQQGLISDYDVNINSTTMEIEVRVKPVQSLNTIQVSFDLAADDISEETASIIGDDNVG